MVSIRSVSTQRNGTGSPAWQRPCGHGLFGELGVERYEVAVIADDCDMAYPAVVEVAYGIYGDGHVGGVLRGGKAVVLDALDGDLKLSEGVACPYLPEMSVVGA